MGKKSPPAPDYVGAAKEQAAASKELTAQQTIANRPDIYTPWGSQTWTQGKFDQAGYDAAVDAWNKRQSSNPGTAMSGALDNFDYGNFDDVARYGAGVAGTMMGVGRNLSDPMPTREQFTNGDQWTMHLNLSPEQQKALDDQQKIQSGRSAGALQLLDQATNSFKNPIDYDSLPTGGQSVTAPTLGDNAPAFSFGGGGNIQTSLGPRTQLPTDVKLDRIIAPSVGAASASAGPLKFQMDHTAGEWRQKGQDAALEFQRPLIERRRAALESQLANMGLTRGSEAWDAEMQRDSDQAMRDQLQAFGAGQSEAKMLFDQDLQSGQFTNSARAQEFSQNLANARLAQEASLASAQMGLSAALANNDFALKGADFRLRAQGQDFNQDLAEAQFGNTAQQQGFNQDLAKGTFYNNAVDQADRRANTNFTQQIQAGNFNQNLRQAALNEAVNRRSQPLNELNALLTGQQVQNPNMPQFNTAGRAETPQLLEAANLGYQADLNSYNANMGMLSNIAQIGANAFMFSDARLKEDIEYTGDSIGGVPVVHYRYRGLPGLRTGVIAQDVLRIKPHAVVLDPSGYLKVNYSELCA